MSGPNNYKMLRLAQAYRSHALSLPRTRLHALAVRPFSQQTEKKAQDVDAKDSNAKDEEHWDEEYREKTNEFKTHRKIMFAFGKTLKYTMWAGIVFYFYHLYLVIKKDKPETAPLANDRFLYWAWWTKTAY
jgi:hypothetical protein